MKNESLPALAKAFEALSRATLEFGERQETLFELQAATLKLVAAHLATVSSMEAQRTRLAQADDVEREQMLAQLNQHEADYAARNREVLQRILDSVARMESESDMRRAYLEQLRAVLEEGKTP